MGFLTPFSCLLWRYKHSATKIYILDDVYHSGDVKDTRPGAEHPPIPSQGEALSDKITLPHGIIALLPGQNGTAFISRKDVLYMVKGINRQVVVVKSPDPKLFEQAIFLLREDVSAGVSHEQVIRQAQQAANDYLRRHSVRSRSGLHLPRAVWGLLGALAASAAWAVSLFLL